MSDVPSGRYNALEKNYGLAGSPTFPTFRQNIGREQATFDLAAPATGVMLSTLIWLEVGETVNKIGFCTGGTALGSGTHFFVALYSNAATPALLAQSTDNTGASIHAADTVYEVALTATQYITKSDFYSVGLSWTATTVPTLMGALQGGNVSRTGLAAATASTALASAKTISQTSGSSLAGTAPATITSGTASAKIPFVYVTS